MIYRNDRIEAVIFDMDGVLADTRAPLVHAWKKVFDEHNIPMRPKAIEPLVLGVVQYERIKEVLSEQFSFDGDVGALIEEAEEYYRSIVPLTVKPVHGLANFLEELRQRSMPMVVATSASRRTMNTVLGALGIGSYFRYALSSEEVTNRKPDPEVFQLAADLLRIEASRCLVFEDAASGIRAAISIGMLCIALTTTFPRDVLKEADLIIDSFEQFPWTLFESRNK